MIGPLLFAFVLGEPAATDVPSQAETQNARAQQRVLVVTGRSKTAADDTALRRIRRTHAELEAAGFEVLEIGLTASIDEINAELIEGLAREHDARALTVLHTEQRRASVWSVGDGGATERRAIVVGSNTETEPDAVFAVRVAEVVRATLIPIEPREVVPAQPRAESPPAEKPPPPPEASPGPRWGARAGVHGVGAVQNLGFMLGPALGASLAVGPRRRVVFDFEALATAVRGRVRSSAGEASVGFGVLRGTAGFWPLPRARVSPGFGLGWGMLLAWTRGRGEAPYRGRVDTTVVNTPVGAADLAIRITPRLRMRLGVRVGVALPAIRIDTEPGSARTAQPLVDGGVALEVIGPGRRRD